MTRARENADATSQTYIENATAAQALSGTYSTERLYFNDSYQLTGDVTVTGHLALGSIADEDIIITQDGTERTITGAGTLEAGNVLQDTHGTDLTGMTGELANSVQDNITRLGTVTSGTYNATIGTSATGFGLVRNAQEFLIDSTDITTTGTDLLVNWTDAGSHMGKIGGQISQASGIFTASETGVYLVSFSLGALSGSSTYIGARIYSNQAGSAPTTLVSRNYTFMSASNQYTTVTTNFIWDVAGTASNYKLKFNAETASSCVFYMGTSTKESRVIFIRLGDT